MIRYFHLSFNPKDTIVRLPGFPSEAPGMFLSLRGAGNMGPSDEGGNESRLRVYGSMGISPGRVAYLKQIHSKVVLSGDDPSRGGWKGEGDGLITRNKEVFLQVTVADCLPVYLYHRGGRAFGIVHSGWKGTGIAAVAVEMMCSLYGLDAEDFFAVIGPGIGPCCYNVDEKRAEYFARNWGSETTVRRKGEYFLDLKAANVAVLSRAGVKNILVSRDCTACGGAFGSFRRQGPEEFSRMIALIGYL